MKILITGGSGLLGNKIAEISYKDHNVFSGYNAHQTFYGTPQYLDITDRNVVKRVLDKIQPDLVIHCAAMTHVDQCERNPELAQKINVLGTRNIVEYSQNVGAFLVYVSTDYVFNGEKGDHQENDVPSPINIYGQTKYEGEQIVMTSKLDYCISRTSVIYGARPAAGKENFALWALKNLKEKNRVNIITDQIISPTYNHNLAEMILEVSERHLIGIFHLAGATYLDRYSFVKHLAEEFGYSTDSITPSDSSSMNWNAKRPRNSTLNTKKADKILENKPLEIFVALRKLHNEIQGNQNI